MYHPQLTRIATTSFRPIFSRAYTASAPAAANRKAKNNNIRKAKTYNYEKDPDNVARGLKAAIHNPKVSTGAKDHAVQQLKEIDNRKKEAQDQIEVEFVRHQLGKENDSTGVEDANFLKAGFKAALSNNKTSKEAKKHAKTVLDSVAKGEIKNVKDVMGGDFNGALKNRYTSPEARNQAEKGLKDHKIKL